MKVLYLRALVLLLPLLSSNAQAAIDYGSNGGGTMGELFLEIWDGKVKADGLEPADDSKTYIKDLGITVQQILDNPGAFNNREFTFAEIALPVLPSTAVWGVKGVNDDGFASLGNTGDFNAPDNYSGMVTTTVQDADLLQAAVTDGSFGFDAVNGFLTEVGTNYVQFINSSGTSDFSEQLEQVFSKGDSGFYRRPSLADPAVWVDGKRFFDLDVFFGWIDTNKLASDTAPMPMFFLTKNGDGSETGAIGNQGKPIGYWSFDGSKLKFTTSPPAARCPAPWDPLETYAVGAEVVAWKTQNGECGSTDKRTLKCGSDGKFDPPAGDFVYKTCTVLKACDLPWGGKLPHNQTATGYSAASAADCTKIRGTLSCQDGDLQGGDTYTFQNCTARAAKSCELPWGGTLESGQSVDAYESETSPDCASIKESRTCDDGTLSGNFEKQSCAAPSPDCDLPWGEKLANTESKIAYAAETSDNCSAVAGIVKCKAGTLEGATDNKFQSCSPPSCIAPWGETVNHGGEVKAYRFADNANCDTTENSESRKCSAGVLGGSFSQQFCGASCTLPSGAVIAHRARIDLYDVAGADDCAAHLASFSCENGSLTGTTEAGGSVSNIEPYRFSACGPAPIACDLPWGGKLADGASVTAYAASTSVSCPSIAETRTCTRGVLSGTLTERACVYPLTLLSPNGADAWRSGIRQLIKWESAGLDAKTRLSLFFSKDGGETWKRINKKRLPPKGDFVWRPGRRHASEQALIRICLPAPKGESPVCDESDEHFSISIGSSLSTSTSQ